MRDHGSSKGWWCWCIHRGAFTRCTPRCIHRSLNSTMAPSTPLGCLAVVLAVCMLAGACVGEVEQWQPDTVPQGIHIAYGSDGGEMNVGWQTWTRGTKSVVRWGEAPTDMSVSVHATTRMFAEGNPNGTQWVHSATMSGLESSKRYFYRVQTGRAMSAIYSFKTLPPPSPDAPAPVQRLLVFGDMGRKGGALSLDGMIEEVTSGAITAVIHAGDFAYDLSSEGGQRGSEFMRMIEPLSAYVPYMVCPGNHEIAFNFSNYLHLFNHEMPAPHSSAMWFSFDVGLIHFISYSTEVYFTDGAIDEQYLWLEKDLEKANNNRAITPWVVAFGHRPMYCSNIDGDDCTTPNSVVRAGLEKLFYDGGVDVIVEAHEHSYERLWPVYNETVTQKNYINPSAPVHVISGAAGCNESDGICENPILGPKGTFRVRVVHFDLATARAHGGQGPWSAFRRWILSYGYGHMEAHNATHLYWDEVLDLTGEVLDSIWVVQENHGPFSSR